MSAQKWLFRELVEVKARASVVCIHKPVQRPEDCSKWDQTDYSHVPV